MLLTIDSRGVIGSFSGLQTPDTMANGATGRPDSHGLPKPALVRYGGRSKVSYYEFKRALGKTADRFSDAKIREMNDLCDRLAGALFDSWKDSMKRQTKIDFEQKPQDAT